MKIGELAKKTACKIVTIRYYEKEGLLAAPERTGGNYRLYGAADLERLQFIMHCRKHGMKLGDIKNLLAFKDNPQPDCAWVSDLLDSHIQNVEEQIASLEHLRYHLEHLRDSCSGGRSGETCPIMRSLSNHGECCGTCAHCFPQAIFSKGF